MFSPPCAVHPQDLRTYTLSWGQNSLYVPSQMAALLSHWAHTNGRFINKGRGRPYALCLPQVRQSVGTWQLSECAHWLNFRFKWRHLNSFLWIGFQDYLSRISLTFCSKLIPLVDSLKNKNFTDPINITNASTVTCAMLMSGFCQQFLMNLTFLPSEAYDYRSTIVCVWCAKFNTQELIIPSIFENSATVFCVSPLLPCPV